MLSKSAIKFIRQLHQKKYRSEHKLFITEGEKNIRELLTSSFAIHSLYGIESWLKETKTGNGDYLVQPVNEKELQEISLLDAPNKAIALVHQPPLQTEVSFKLDKNYLLLDTIRDPGNFGTLLRIADWFGIHQIIYSPDCVEIFNPKVVQSSMGSIFRVDFIQCRLKELLSGFNIKKAPAVYGAALEGKSLYDVKFGKGSILVIGNESNGITSEVKPFIGMSITIPSFNKGSSKPESLNAAIAAAICCSEIRRQQAQ